MFKKVKTNYGWKPGSINLDLGSGPYELFTKALKEEQVKNLRYDPVRLSELENWATITAAETFGVDTVTLSNVLCVIRYSKERRKLLKLAKKAIRPGGYVFITIYEGDGTSRARETKYGWQNNRKLRSYLPEVKRVFPNAEIKQGMIVAQGVDSG